MKENIGNITIKDLKIHCKKTECSDCDLAIHDNYDGTFVCYFVRQPPSRIDLRKKINIT